MRKPGPVTIDFTNNTAQDAADTILLSTSPTDTVMAGKSGEIKTESPKHDYNKETIPKIPRNTTASIDKNS